MMNSLLQDLKVLKLSCSKVFYENNFFWLFFIFGSMVVCLLVGIGAARSIL